MAQGAVSNRNGVSHPGQGEGYIRLCNHSLQSGNEWATLAQGVDQRLSPEIRMCGKDPIGQGLGGRGVSLSGPDKGLDQRPGLHTVCIWYKCCAIRSTEP